MIPTEPLDAIFQALSNSTRREVVAALASAPKGSERTAGELAAPFDMALPSFMQHMQVLETCGLVRSTKRGRVRTFQLIHKEFRRATRWLEKQRLMWEQRLDQLDQFIQTQKP